MIKFTGKQYAEAFFQALAEVPPQDEDKVVQNFAEVLREGGAIKIFPEIEQEFERLDRQARGVQLAEVTTTRAIPKSAEPELIRKLNVLVSGKVELRQKIDAGLIGGMVVRLEDRILDGSVRGNLNDLKEELIK